MLAFLLAPAAWAGSRQHDVPRDGSDIAQLRSILDNGLSRPQQDQAYSSFVANYPRSPLAELALMRCLSLGLDMDAVLGELSQADRSYLVSRFKSHQERLASSPSTGPWLSDAASPVAPADRPLAGRPEAATTADRAIGQ